MLFDRGAVMGQVLSWVARQVLRLIFLSVTLVVITVAMLFVITRGEHPVPATVTDDPSLRRIEVAGVALHAERFGLTKGRTVIVLHGGPGGDYRSQLALRALSDDLQVVFYDQRGAGLSERVDETALTLDAHIAELDGMVDLTSPQTPVVLIGHSWGATLAAAYLARHPDRVAGVVLIEPGFLDWAGLQRWMAEAGAVIRSWPMIRLAATAWAESLHVSGDPQARRDHMMGRIVFGFADQAAMGYRCPGARYDAPGWRFGGLANAAMSASATPEQIDAIAAGARAFPRPVLILTGACSTKLGAAVQRTHAALFPQGIMKVIDGAAHDVVWDAPEPALAEIRTFLDTLPR